MKLHEYQSKQIFSRYGIPIPKGRVAATASEARLIAEELGGRVVIKSQVLVGGRGKARHDSMTQSQTRPSYRQGHGQGQSLRSPVRRLGGGWPLV